MARKQHPMLSSLFGQAAVIVWLVLLFVCGGVYTYHHAGTMTPAVAMIPVVCVALFAALVVGWWWFKAERGFPDIGRWLWNRRWLWLLLVICFLVRLPGWGTPPQDDGMEYYEALYRACHDFRFDGAYIFQNFRLANHPTWGMALLAAIPEFFMPGNYNSFWVFHTLIALVAVAAAYDLLTRQKGGGQATAFWAALAVGSTPIFLGLTSHVSVEPALGAFFLCMVWAYGRGQCLLLAFTCALTAFSKELGIVLVAGFVLGIFVCEFLSRQEKGFWRRVRGVLQTPVNAVMFGLCLAGGVFVLWYLFNPSGWAVRALNGENSILQIAVNPAYIWEKIQEYIFTNFDWLLLGLCVLCFVRRMRHRGQYPTLPSYLAGILLAILLFEAVSALAVTFTITRYNLAPELALAFLCVSVVSTTLPARISTWLVGVLAVLLCTQAYLTVDPVMKALYPEVVTGGVSMVRVKKDDQERHMSHYVIYNNQYSYLYKGLREIFRKYSPEDHDLIVLGTDGFIYLQGRLWDRNKQDFAMLNEGDIVPISSFETDKSFQTALQEDLLKEHAILLCSPTYAEWTLTAEEERAMIPDCYSNVEQQELACGTAGKILYFTADLAEK